MKYKDKFEEVNYWEIDYHDFEKIVQEVYGVKDYEFVADQECGNDSQHSFSTDRKYWDFYEENNLEEFINGTAYNYITSTLIQDLARKEFIPEGDILINVSW